MWAQSIVPRRNPPATVVLLTLCAVKESNVAAGRPDPDFSDWVEAIAESGDRIAFARLFEHFAPRIKAYLMRAGASGSAAEELMQEVMLTVWRRAALFDRGKAAVSTWIFTIARNKRIDRIRRETRAELDPHDPALVPTAPEAADTVVEKSQAAERLRAAVELLPAEQMEVLRRSYFEAESHSVIAADLGLPLGTVKSRLRLALSRLRSVLQEQS